MKRRTVVIAIDGPAASGKSSTAQMVADKLGFLHVDSGSLYRAATAAILRKEEDSSRWTEADVLRAAEPVGLRAARTSFYPVLDGRAIEEEIRGSEVTRNVSRVAQMPRVREWVNGRVREAAAATNVVVDGRDMGTVVFPEADLKIFLVADSRERALRRLRQRGTPTSEKLLDDSPGFEYRVPRLGKKRTARSTGAGRSYGASRRLRRLFYVRIGRRRDGI